MVPSRGSRHNKRQRSRGNAAVYYVCESAARRIYEPKTGLAFPERDQREQPVTLRLL